MLSHFLLNSPLIFEDRYINILIIERSSYFYKIVKELHMQSKDLGGEFVLSDKNITLPLSKNISLITNPFTIDPNERDTINGLFSKMKIDAMGEELYLDTNELILKLEFKLQNIMSRQPMQLVMENLDMINLFKIANIKFEISEPLLEKLCDYVSILSEYRKIKLFIFINIKSYMTESDLEQFYTFVQYQKINILLIERYSSNHLKSEKIKIIDEDICEIDIEVEKII